MAISNRSQSGAIYEHIEVKNPVTSEIIGSIPQTSADEIKETIERARDAQIGWGALSPSERVGYIRRWADLVWEQQETLIKINRRETGKTDSGAFLEIIVLDNILQYYIHHAPNFLKTQQRRTIVPFIQKAKVFYKPHGVVGVISPWNYPYLLGLIDLVPALIAGNSALLKPSEVTPFTAEYAIKLMHEAGIPRDVVQVIHGDGRAGATLVEHVDYIAFTGSTATGRKVAETAAKRLIPYSLELGGKDPCIVLEDADLDMTAAGLVRSAFENAGQVCISVERVYADARIYDALMDKLLYYAGKYQMGSDDGMDIHMGSMTNTRELERTEAHIHDAISKGARVVFGGRRRPELGPLFFEPTILADVDHAMDVMRQETFGPILPVMKFHNLEEAIRLANDSEYGLSASIFTRDFKRAEAIARRLDSGDVSVNRPQMVVATPSLPSGGQRNSGVGRRNGKEGLLRFTHTQSFLTDNLFGQQPELRLADPFSLQVAMVLRTIRRYIKFI
ncbi:MAG: succinic semialdehyde dehydrogenase [Anaerolineae bacterium]|nr:succinic semialdehyde dehydrogenase [Anaerolineae bacterium]